MLQETLIKIRTSWKLYVQGAVFSYITLSCVFQKLFSDIHIYRWSTTVKQHQSNHFLLILLTVRYVLCSNKSGHGDKYIPRPTAPPGHVTLTNISVYHITIHNQYICLIDQNRKPAASTLLMPKCSSKSSNIPLYRMLLSFCLHLCLNPDRRLIWLAMKSLI